MIAKWEGNGSPGSDEGGNVPASAWVNVENMPSSGGPTLLEQQQQQQPPHIGNFLQLSEMSSANASQDWTALPYAFPYDSNWWNAVPEGLAALDTTQTDSSPNTGNDSQTNLSAGHSNPTAPASSTSKQKKRRRTTSEKHDGGPAIGAIPTLSPSGEALARAKTELSTCSWTNIDLTGVASLPCEQMHAFAMTSMGPDPLDYYGAPLRTGSFQARIIEPFTPHYRRPYLQLPGSDSLVVRPPTKSLHLVFTMFPLLGPMFSLESGFALMTACRRKADQSRWYPVGFVSYEEGKTEKKMTGKQIGFIGNLERCSKEAGKRVWGERTSHTDHTNDCAKPVRIEPRGSRKNFSGDDHFCILVSLHTPNGRLISDTMGDMCIARTNPFHFQEKHVDTSLQHLLQVLDKLSISQRTSLINSAQDRELSLVLSVNATSTQEAAGLMSQARIAQLPSTACPFSTFFSNKQRAPESSDVLIRLRHVARLMGELHSNPELTSKYPAYLKSGNVEAANGRFAYLADTGIETHEKWLKTEGVRIKPSQVVNRAQNLGTMLAERRYRSHWIICVGNLYPDAIMVDHHDPTVVYSLAEDGRESPLELCDRLYPLARLAFTSKVARKHIESTLLGPYQIGCGSMDPSKMSDAVGGKEKAISFERFWLHLHAIHLDYFLYWTQFRNGQACRRIEEMLLAEDKSFDKSFFGPDRFKRFMVSPGDGE